MEKGILTLKAEEESQMAFIHSICVCLMDDSRKLGSDEDLKL